MTKGFEGFLIDGKWPEPVMPKIRFTERWRVTLDKDVMSPADLAATLGPVL